MPKKRRTFKKGSKGVSYMGIPHSVTRSADFRFLSGSETKILLMIADQYNGYNNGDLQASFTLAQTRGIGSEQTLSRALKSLQQKNLIINTRAGMFQNPGRKCSLYALTWAAIDECGGKLDIASTRTPPRIFSIEKIERPSTKNVVSGYKRRSQKTQSRKLNTNDDYKKCSHTGESSIPVATKSEDLNKLPSTADN